MAKNPGVSLDDAFDILDKSLSLQFYWVCPVCETHFLQEDVNKIYEHRERLAKHIEDWKESVRSYSHLIGQQITFQYIWKNDSGSSKVHVTKNQVTGFRSFYETPDIRDFCIRSPVSDLDYWQKRRQRVWLVLKDLYVPNIDKDGWDREYYVVTYQIEASEISSDLTVRLPFDFEDEEEWLGFIKQLKDPSKIP